MRNVSKSVDDAQVKGMIRETAGATALIVALNIAANSTKDNTTVNLMRLALPLTLAAGLVSAVAGREYFKERAKEGNPPEITPKSFAITNSNMKLMAAADASVVITAITAGLVLAARSSENVPGMAINSAHFFATTLGSLALAKDVVGHLSQREMNWLPKLSWFQQKQQPTSNPEVVQQSAPVLN